MEWSESGIELSRHLVKKSKDLRINLGFPKLMINRCKHMHGLHVKHRFIQ
jgi:hypothetical protein